MIPSSVEQEWKDRLAAANVRIAKLEAALREIIDKYGKVCSDFELCDHASCNSSSAAWLIAAEALRGGGAS